jgi:hypothetical protein
LYRAIVACSCTLLTMLVPLRPCIADSTTIRGVRVWSCSDVSEYISAEGNRVYLTFPGTPRWELEGSAQDYCPMPVDLVEDALRAIDYPIDDLEIEVLILPVPRSHVPESSAEARVVFLSPGRLPYPDPHVHYVVAHEIGHVVQHLLMPKSRPDLWETYMALRGLPSEAAEGSGEHAWRPAEIFAEDFRILFGDDLARCGGNVENHEIAGPEQVGGLREFIQSLPDQWDGRVRINAYPNPFESDVVVEAFTLGTQRCPIEAAVLDVQGKMLRDLNSPADVSTYLVWDGCDRQGREVAPGVYFIVVRAGNASAIHKLIKR